MRSGRQSFPAHTLERSASCVLLNSAMLCRLHLPNLARLSIILKKMQWEGMGYSHINLNHVWKLFHVSMKLEQLKDSLLSNNFHGVNNWSSRGSRSEE